MSCGGEGPSQYVNLLKNASAGRLEGLDCPQCNRPDGVGLVYTPGTGRLLGLLHVFRSFVVWTGLALLELPRANLRKVAIPSVDRTPVHRTPTELRLSTEL
jgi:hypothetical protein